MFRRITSRGSAINVLRDPRRHGLVIELLERREVLFSTGFLSFIPPDVLSQLGIEPAQPVHENITQSALSFLNSDVLQKIVTADVGVDVNTLAGYLPNTSRYHFDNSQFAESAALINQEYQSALGDSEPQTFNSAALASQFGSLLHTVQDFYAHSNWVNFPELTNRLVETSDSFWNLHPRGVMLLEGALPPKDTITRVIDPVTQLPTDQFLVQTPRGTFDGILSDATASSFGFPNTNNTSTGIAISHDEINKDYSGRPLFSQAYNLAVEQTAHEFERLCHLIAAQYQQAGVVELLQQWVKPDPTSQAAAWQASGLSPTIASVSSGTTNNSQVAAAPSSAASALFTGVGDPGMALIGTPVALSQAVSQSPSPISNAANVAISPPPTNAPILAAAVSALNQNAAVGITTSNSTQPAESRLPNLLSGVDNQIIDAVFAVWLDDNAVLID